MFASDENRGSRKGVFGENDRGGGGTIGVEKSEIQAAFFDAGDRCGDLKTFGGGQFHYCLVEGRG
jgi:hypothetical protein